MSIYTSINVKRDLEKEYAGFVEDNKLDIWSLCEELYEGDDELKLFVESNRILHFAEEAIASELKKFKVFIKEIIISKAFDLL